MHFFAAVCICVSVYYLPKYVEFHLPNMRDFRLNFTVDNDFWITFTFQHENRYNTLYDTIRPVSTYVDGLLLKRTSAFSKPPKQQRKRESQQNALKNFYLASVCPLTIFQGPWGTRTGAFRPHFICIYFQTFFWKKKWKFRNVNSIFVLY